jgi:hypothetical protein
MSTTDSPTLKQVYTALLSFIATIVPTGTEIVQALNNRVPAPAGPYVLMQAMFQLRLATDVVTYSDPHPSPGSAIHEQSTRLDIQLDFFGPSAADWAAMFSTLFRSDAGCVALAPHCQPLYADSARQIPYTTGEDQFFERWSVTGSLQWNPATSITQEFADTLTADIINVDVTYPPEA